MLTREQAEVNKKVEDFNARLERIELEQQSIITIVSNLMEHLGTTVPVCNHPEDKRRTLKNGRILCEVCKKFVKGTV